jgi:DNA-binding HxlR family transcriptional regulator
MLGDKWSLVILRDIMFGNRRYFRELLRNSEEGIASNILADRLHLTEPAIQLVPIMAHLGAWGRRHLPVTRELAIRAELLEAGGPELWDRFMDELREQHLGIARPAGAESVFGYLQAAYEAELATG